MINSSAQVKEGRYFPSVEVFQRERQKEVERSKDEIKRAVEGKWEREYGEKLEESVVERMANLLGQFSFGIKIVYQRMNGEEETPEPILNLTTRRQLKEVFEENFANQVFFGYDPDNDIYVINIDQLKDLALGIMKNPDGESVYYNFLRDAEFTLEDINDATVLIGAHEAAHEFAFKQQNPDEESMEWRAFIWKTDLAKKYFPRIYNAGRLEYLKNDYRKNMNRK